MLYCKVLLRKKKYVSCNNIPYLRINIQRIKTNGALKLMCIISYKRPSECCLLSGLIVNTVLETKTNICIHLLFEMDSETNVQFTSLII